MKKTVKLLSFLLCVLMTASVIVPFSASAKNSRYVNELINKGFPEDYAVKLADLHEKHPNWSFEPLNVTQMSRELNKSKAYTWEYVIYMETDDNPKRSLVYNSDAYINWRHPSNQQYDSGWWRASVETVEYFMDPRNFFNEEQIFQFYDLKWSDSITLSAVEAVVKGTFMENKKLDDKYSDTTYAKYFYDTGKELGVSPVYLAARVRAEQGTAGTSPLINGNVGDKLWYYYSNKMTGKDEAGHIINAPTSGYTEEQLLSYNGYYNYFNIGSAGTGYFEIYKNGIDEAKRGTAEKKSDWGGDASWNKHWKSLYGGAYAATNKYVYDYQNIPYLQKFNVDPRSSRNFWGQYMQSITGSVGMATQSYNTFKANNMLDLAYTFLIPVYEGMPDEPCPHPDTLPSATNRARITNSCVDSYGYSNKTFSAAGWVGCNFKINRFGYSIDGKDTVWSGVSIVSFANAQDEAAVKAAAGENAVRFRASFKDAAFTEGKHTVMIMAEVNDGSSSVIKALVSNDGTLNTLSVTVKAGAAEEAKVTNSYIDRENDSAEGRELCFFEDGEETVFYVKGWFGLNCLALKTGYSIDGGAAVYDGSVTMTRDEGLDPHVNGGLGYRFEARINTKKLSKGQHTLVLTVIADDGKMTELNALRTAVIQINKTKEALSYTPGDINDDGELDNKDVVVLFRYLNDPSVAVNVYAVDVNGDGEPNNKDVTTLFRYLNGADIVIY